ncbi:MAG: chemotaxis protein CheW [Lachnoclostridium sp.]|nr:chemotaxis protein CheW [Lachnoclostridium sp.]
MTEMPNNEELEVLGEIQYIVIRLGGESYGIPISIVDNIVRMQRTTRVPKGQPSYIGVINLRGEIVPVMSIRRRFGLNEDEFTNKTRIIIVKLEDQSLIGLIVDEVKEVVNLDASTIETPSFKLSEEKAAFLSGIGKHDEGLISLLDIDSVVSEKKRE